MRDVEFCPLSSSGRWFYNITLELFSDDVIILACKVITLEAQQQAFKASLAPFFVCRQSWVIPSRVALFRSIPPGFVLTVL